MEEELWARDKNHTWELVKLPNEKKVVGNKWIYKIKYKSDGTIERPKVRNSAETVVVLVYVDDIIVTGRDIQGIDQLKKYLGNVLDIKYLKKLRYFLGIEVAYSKKGLFLSQKKYTLDLLTETGKTGAKPIDTLVGVNNKISIKDGEPLQDVGYLTITKPDITYVVSMDVNPLDKKSTTGLCAFVGGNMVTWKSKKQNVVTRSSAEAEYRAMASTTCELIWLKSFLNDLGFKSAKPIPLFCDNQAAIHIAIYPVFHERTKYIEVDCHFVREKVQAKMICTPQVNSEYQLENIFTTAVGKEKFIGALDKLGSFNLFAPT
ncbi:uncharacterized protein LOC110008568 [Amborella trichopoda]|uniref:uncharacterized protein LOC110008568 n=1 Tax=Amborella trichopoda TaxID=13333 RepID=UPI0009BCB25D|nr:uncharacterized protein LOC110008568 [Amborella trichopoda]|eukprot:XP_020532292.1 uncharacterized protein LOC110008568 [Amborella trichopoda]